MSKFLLIKYSAAVNVPKLSGSKYRRVSRVRRGAPETILLSLKRRGERAERHASYISETRIRMAAPELRLAPVPRREGRRRHAVE